MTAVVDGRDPNVAPRPVTLPAALVARVAEVLEKPGVASVSETVRLIRQVREGLAEAVERKVPVALYACAEGGEKVLVGQVQVLAEPDAEPQGLAWAVRRALVYNVGPGGEEFSDDDVSEWET